MLFEALGDALVVLFAFALLGQCVGRDGGLVATPLERSGQVTKRLP